MTRPTACRSTSRSSAAEIQGFIEVALTSTELVLQEQLGLDPPSWLPDDYYLGARA